MSVAGAEKIPAFEAADAVDEASEVVLDLEDFIGFISVTRGGLEVAPEPEVPDSTASTPVSGGWLLLAPSSEAADWLVRGQAQVYSHLIGRSGAKLLLTEIRMAIEAG